MTKCGSAPGASSVSIVTSRLFVYTPELANLFGKGWPFLDLYKHTAMQCSSESVPRADCCSSTNNKRTRLFNFKRNFGLFTKVGKFPHPPAVLPFHSLSTIL